MLRLFSQFPSPSPNPNPMSYTVQQLADLASISVRTLHHYDEIGLLTPARSAKNDYREYGEPELLRLQQILFFRELEFPLEDIKVILDKPEFDVAIALKDHRELLTLKQKRLGDLLETIDKTLAHVTTKTPMDDKDMYGGFTKEEMERYAAEAKQRWGHTDAYKQSAERTKHFTKDDYKRIAKEGDNLMKRIAAHIKDDPASDAVQELIAEHFNNLRTFYEPSIELYRGLGNMYADDARFRAYFEKHHKNLPEFMRDAMEVFCEGLEKK